MSSLLWPCIVAAPLAGLLLLRLNPARVEPWLCLVVVPALLAAFWPPAVPLAMDFLWPEAQLGGSDLVSRAWLAFTALLWGCTSVFASASLPHDGRRTQFWTFWLLALAGNLLLIIAQDALSFYVGFTAMSLSAYGLIVHLGGPAPRRAGRLYLQLAVVGEFAVFAGLLLRAHAAAGSLDIEQWLSVPLDNLTFVLLLVGFGLKIGFWPLHVWLPLAHPAAPAPASAVLSGAMLKAGVLGLWRFLPAGDPVLQQWAEPVLALGLFTAFYGVVLGVMTTHPKATLAYSSVSQMGYFLIILALAWRHPEQLTEIALLLVLFAVHHGLAKGGLFLAAGIVAEGRVARGRWAWCWWLLLAAPALALAGLPLTSGAAAKVELKHLFAEGDFRRWLLLLSLGSTGTTVLVLRALVLIWRKHDKGKKVAGGWRLRWPWALLSCASLLLPWLWPAMREPLVYSLSLSNTWTLLWPPLIAVLIAALALFFHWRPPAALARQQHPALKLSLRLKRLIQWPPVPPLEPPWSKQRWRQRERRWNHFWQSGSVKLSAWVLCGLLLLLLGWLW